MSEIPNTVVECDGCGEELNLLAKHLVVMVKPQRAVLVMEDVASADPDEAPDSNIFLGSKKGRGVRKLFHDFECAHTWFNERFEWKPKIELHKEDEIFVPEDNRSPEEIAEEVEA